MRMPGDRAGRSLRNIRLVIVKHEIIIYWSDEDEAFIAEAPELPGCMVDGATRPRPLRTDRP